MIMEQEDTLAVLASSPSILRPSDPFHLLNNREVGTCFDRRVLGRFESSSWVPLSISVHHPPFLFPTFNLYPENYQTCLAPQLVLTEQVRQ